MLTVELEAQGQHRSEVVLEAPSGFSGDGERLVIESASRVTWEVTSGWVFDAKVKPGGALEFSAPSGAYQRSTKGHPAFALLG